MLQRASPYSSELLSHATASCAKLSCDSLISPPTAFILTLICHLLRIRTCTSQATASALSFQSLNLFDFILVHLINTTPLLTSITNTTEASDTMSFIRNVLSGWGINSQKRSAPEPAGQEPRSKRVHLELNDNSQVFDPSYQTAPLNQNHGANDFQPHSNFNFTDNFHAANDGTPLNFQAENFDFTDGTAPINFEAQSHFDFTNDSQTTTNGPSFHPSRQLVPVVSRSEASNFLAQPGFNFSNNPYAAPVNTVANTEVFQDAQESTSAGAEFAASHDDFHAPQDFGAHQQCPHEVADEFITAEDQDGNPLYQEWEAPQGAYEPAEQDPDLYTDEELNDLLGNTDQQQSNVAVADQQMGTGMAEGNVQEWDEFNSAAQQHNEAEAEDQQMDAEVSEDKVQEWDELGSSPSHSEADGEESDDNQMEDPVDLTKVTHQYDPMPQQMEYEQYGSPQQQHRFHQNAMTQEQFLNGGAFPQVHEGNQQDAIQIEDDGEFQGHASAQTTDQDKSEGNEQSAEDDDDAHSDLFASTFGNKAAAQSVIDISDDDDDEEGRVEGEANATARQTRRLSTPPLPIPEAPSIHAPKPAPPAKKERNRLRPGANIYNDVTKLLKVAYKRHEQAFTHLSKIPNHSLPAYPWPSRRYWIAVQLENKTPDKVRSEKDYIWMKGNRFTTVRTVRETYLTTTFSAAEGLEIWLAGGEAVELEDVMEELDYFGDRFVVFRAVRVEVMRAKGVVKAESLVKGIADPVVEIAID